MVESRAPRFLKRFAGCDRGRRGVGMRILEGCDDLGGPGNVGVGALKGLKQARTVHGKVLVDGGDIILDIYAFCKRQVRPQLNDRALSS